MGQIREPAICPTELIVNKALIADGWWDGTTSLDWVRFVSHRSSWAGASFVLPIDGLNVAGRRSDS
jgi:hypothetical protein